MVRNKRGFTLMEILVVVTIIGILAAIAVPSYLQAVEQGRREACATNVQVLLAQVERYNLTTGEKVPAGQDFVRYLLDRGYLVGEEPKCPYSSGEYQPKYELKYVQDRAVICCTHCHGEND